MDLRHVKFFSNKRTSSKPEGDGDIIKKSPENLKELFKASYDPLRFAEANDSKFLERLRISEEEEKAKTETRDWKTYLKNLEIPIFILLGSAFTFYIWNSCPFTVVFKHFTLSEYTIQKFYFHTIFTSSLSFRAKETFIVYFPLIAYCSLILAKNLKARHFAILFLVNSLITSMVTLLYEKYNNGFNQQMILPKVNGDSTALALISCLAGFSPQHSFFGFRFLPFAVIPLVCLLYQINEYREGKSKMVSEPAHIIAIFNGLFIGMIFRRYAKLVNIR